MEVDAIGWISAAILVLTLLRQVYTQWRSESVAGVSRWLFIGQLAASFGFTVYSFLVENWVFVFANAFLCLTAIAGQLVYVRNTRRTRRKPE
jgi:MtN3 and saliva related transmembrane protein